ncbi:MAG TPA: DUF4364 family protein [Thermoclostridium sp.]|nr:DUF4364 family protein [Clostridiaceae bacterium]HOQ75645.1 DUF4364 family protein [Thermoclostridium sp.]HPU45531.1 DUF4364 family protein [Thermoclostridium sp.]
MDYESFEKAENKVLLLYFLRQIQIPVSNMQLTRVILENRFMNYFLLQQGLHELISDRLISSETRDNIDYYTISEQGVKILEMFEGILPAGIKTRIGEVADAIRTEFRHEASIIAEYTLENENEYEVRCKIVENSRPLIDIRLSVGSRDDARHICSNWKEQAQEIYPQVIGVLLGRGRE